MMQLNSKEQQQLEELCALSFDFARQNDTQNLKILLDSGLNANLANHKGDTLLMLAAYHNSLEAAKMLIEYGAQVDKPNDKNHTPLAGVCFKGYYEMAKLLLESGANPDGKGALSPMNCAIMFRRKEILDLLLQYTKAKPSALQRIWLWWRSKNTESIATQQKNARDVEVDLDSRN
ncbi:ankyrin repeat domain-containing protein [uncultured Helicobacter sp.]|uniref:ankyrin repeat domain-containing protein n=1 Tax=uncultured Helicobacter sp. TaxID=175537 RepID=UPI00258E3991|nr:ankyrin repeat domain-containing protein [uncultured Helicobacter sp.]